MFNKSIIFVSILCASIFGFGCKDGSSNVNSQGSGGHSQKAYPTSVNDQITDSVTQSAPAPSALDQSTTGVPGDFPPHQDPLDQSSANYITYYTKSWSLAASEEWTLPKSRIPYVELSLVNSGRGLLFTLLSEATDKTQQQYVDAQIKTLQGLGIKNVTSQKTTVNGLDYWLISAPNSNYNDWQWVTFKENRAHVLGCGLPKDYKTTAGAYESCLDLVISASPGQL